MRRLALVFSYSALIILTSFWSACGGGSSSTVNVAASVVISPASISLSKGELAQASASAQDKDGATVAADFKFASSNEDLFTVSPGGAVCAGKWDTNFINCTPTTSTGNAKLTVTTLLNGVSSSIDVFIHDPVDEIVMSGGTSCTSSGETQQLSAKAYSHNPAVCGGASSCELPANTVGQFTFGSRDADVVSIDNRTTIGLATAGIPGRAFVFPVLGKVVGPSMIFETCLVRSVTLAIKDSTNTSIALDKGATQALVATAVDTKDKTLTSPPLVYFPAQPFVDSVTAGAQAVTGTLTALNPGSSFVQAACISPGCNRCATGNCNSQTVNVYSTPIQVQVNGTSNGTVYAASSDSTQLVPVDVTTNTPGTTITLPNPPNSMAVNQSGARLALGGGTNPSMSVDIATSVISILTANGTVLGFSRDGGSALIVDTADKKFHVNVEKSTSLGYVIDPPISHFDSWINPSNVLASNGTTNFYGVAPLTFTTATRPAAVNDIAMLLTGQATYFAGGTSAGIDIISQCDGSQIGTENANNPTLAEALPNGDGAVFLDGGNLIVLHNVNIGTTGGQVCPPTITESRNVVALGLPAGFKTNQLLVTPDSTKAILSTDQGLVIVNLSTFTATKVTLAAGAVQTFQGDTTLDSKSFYIGADDGTVHRIDLSNNTDAQQIAVSLKKADGTAALPQFVVVAVKA
jgi:hypothetical protein